MNDLFALNPTDKNVCDALQPVGLISEVLEVDCGSEMTEVTLNQLVFHISEHCLNTNVNFISSNNQEDEEEMISRMIINITRLKAELESSFRGETGKLASSCFFFKV